ncbi:MAG: hypothetical protein D6780_03330 [Candidatus Dadabacteria bacterium]|nr:MAG: hypothetical protein D6780_03330 [Candidatus Dadabacteria bacterium]
MIIEFCGIAGSGKSTQARALIKNLRSLSLQSCYTLKEKEKEIIRQREISKLFFYFKIWAKLAMLTVSEEPFWNLFSPTKTTVPYWLMKDIVLYTFLKKELRGKDLVIAEEGIIQHTASLKVRRSLVSLEEKALKVIKELNHPLLVFYLKTNSIETAYQRVKKRESCSVTLNFLRRYLVELEGSLEKIKSFQGVTVSVLNTETSSLEEAADSVFSIVKEKVESLTT